MGEATAPTTDTSQGLSGEGVAPALLAASLLVDDALRTVLPVIDPLAGSLRTLLVSADVSGRTLSGTAGPDRLKGTDADEAFLGYAGADTIYGGGGHDTIDATAPSSLAWTRPPAARKSSFGTPRNPRVTVVIDASPLRHGRVMA